MVWADHVLDGARYGCLCQLCGSPRAPKQDGPALSDERITEIAREYAFRTAGRLRIVGDLTHPYSGTRAA